MTLKYFLPSILFSIVFICSCSTQNSSVPLKDDQGLYQCDKIESLITDHQVSDIKVVRHIGLLMDTTIYRYGIDSCFLGPRLLVLGDEFFPCRELSMDPYVDENSVLWLHKKTQNKDHSNSWTREHVNKYWPIDDHPLLDKSLPEIQLTGLGHRDLNEMASRISHHYWRGEFRIA